MTTRGANAGERHCEADNATPTPEAIAVRAVAAAAGIRHAEEGVAAATARGGSGHRQNYR